MSEHLKDAGIPAATDEASTSAQLTADEGKADVPTGEQWWKVAEAGYPREGDRIHCKVEGRFVTVFRNRGELSAIDSVCHHAAGPLTIGEVVDIEELGMTVVKCPWHKFSVGIKDGRKAFQGVDIIGGVPKPSGWKVGKIVQRAHLVKENIEGVFVVSSRYLPSKLRLS
jgi:nitrite reductase/ring-hydroxylating ferredoxin subunit